MAQNDWIKIKICWTNTEFGAYVPVSAASTSGPSAFRASASRASTSGASASGAPTIRERVGALNMDDDPLVDVVVDDDDDDDDDVRTNTEFRAYAPVSAASASGPSAFRASASRASTSGASTSGASTIRERVGALNMDDDPLVDVVIDDDVRS
nr:hypothetical protein [Tanacetum cinerariifolium]